MTQDNRQVYQHYIHSVFTSGIVIVFVIQVKNLVLFYKSYDQTKFTMSLYNYKNDNEIVTNNNNDFCAKLYKGLGNGLPIVACLSDLIAELNLAFATDSVNIELVSYLMKTYKQNPIEWKKYAKFDRYR